MIENILQLLSSNEFYGKSELIEIAKGKYKLETTLKGKAKQIKRQKEWQLRKR